MKTNNTEKSTNVATTHTGALHASFGFSAGKGEDETRIPLEEQLRQIADNGYEVERTPNGILITPKVDNKLYQVVEAIIPVANEIYDKESLDLVEISNPTNRVICSPGEFKLGEVLSSEEFYYDNRSYENEDGSEKISGVFAAKFKMVLIALTIMTLGLFSCSNITNSFEDQTKLQKTYSTVYKLNQSQYVVIDSSNTVYHLGVNLKGEETYKIKIK